ncbi:MAG: HEPN domain-containing protein [Thermoplasmata archaeon]|nr:HEPN domain-containing protein [Thermoplasmata archaeon]
MNEFERCLKDRRILKFFASPEMVQKEMDSAEYDLMHAEDSLLREDSKWSSVQSYYSMFHSAKALVLQKGYREKNHYCLIIALRELYVKTGEIEEEAAENLEMCMDIRHEADYGLTYSPEAAKLALDAAKKMFQNARRLLGSE